MNELKSFYTQTSGQSELENIIPPEIKNDEFYFLIQKLAQQENIKTILELGSSAGTGSTEAFVKGLRQNRNKPTLFCMEISKPRFAKLQKKYSDVQNVKCYNLSSVPLEKFPTEQEICSFYFNTKTALNNYPLERVLGWLRQDIEYMKSTGLCSNGIQKIKEENNIKNFDMVLIDGSEFAGTAELNEIYGAKFILLDDINGFKNFNNYKRLMKDPYYDLITEDWELRNGFAVFARNGNTLPIHFFTIVLNGQPFIRHHIEVFKQLPFKWHWHIIEGVAAHKHDTAWSLQLGGRITDDLHHNGLSNDGTTEYLDELTKQFPDNITVYRKTNGVFWDGKLEMVNAPLVNINEECLLWQVDSDELWTAEQICTARQMFIDNSDKTAAYYYCWFFVGENLVITTRDTYGNNTGYEWVRTWQFKPGYRWTAHEPPQLCKQIQDERWIDTAKINPFRHRETEARDLVFQHYAYVVEKQIRFKELYYGYENAIEKWNLLQKEARLPVLLRDYFSWVKDQAIVDRIQSQCLYPIAQKNALNQWHFRQHKPLPNKQQAIPDIDSSVGNVLTASMLPSSQSKIPLAARHRKNILVVSHERSGTHFLMNTIALNFPYYSSDEISVLGNSGDLNKIFTEYYSREEKRIFKSHHQFNFFEPFFIDLVRHFHVFYVVRDGRDVLTSCFHYFNNAPTDKFPHTRSINELLLAKPSSDFPQDNSYSLRQADNMIERWCIHVEGWSAVKDKITFVKYEDLKHNFENTVAYLANILGFEVPDRLTVPSLTDRSIFPRKGKVGDWRNHFTDADLSIFNDIASEYMIKLGYYKEDLSEAQIAQNNNLNQIKFPQLKSPPSETKNILWVRSDSIGDNVLAASMLPYVRQKYKDAKITVVCQDHIAEIYQPCPFVDNIISFNRRQALENPRYKEKIIKHLQELKPELSLNSVYSRDPLSDELAIECGANQHIAMEGNLSNISAELRDKYNRFYGKLLPSKGEHKLELERHRDFLCGLNIDVTFLKPMLWITAKDVEFAEKFFKEHALNPEQTIALFAGAQFKVRLCDKYGEALAEFCRKNKLKVVALGAEQEYTINQWNLDAIGVDTFNLSGRTTIRQSIAILNRCRLAVGAETGLAHISCAVGTPNVILLGGGHFGRFMPYSELTSVVCLPLECYGCNWKCTYGHPHCIRDVKPEVITQAIQQSFEKRSEKPRVFVQSSSLWEPGAGQPSWKQIDGHLDAGNVEIITVEWMTSETPENRYNLESFTKSSNENMNNFARFESAEEHENRYLVTAIVSTYNSERFIRDCLEDLENQTIADRLEIIVVNSGSQQNEEAVVKEFQQRYKNIKYIKTEQRETIYKAWNRAIKVAAGKYITNANTDDRHTKDALEKMAVALEQNPDKVLIFADQIRIKEVNGQKVTIGRTKKSEFSRDQLFEGQCTPGSQPMWRKNVHDVFGYFDEEFVVSGDYEFWFRLTQKFDFLYMEKTLGERFVSPDIVGIINNDLLSWENEMVIHKCYKYALQEDLTIGTMGISEHPIFSTWPEVNIWKQQTKAKLENRQISLVDNIKDTWDFRTNPSPKLTIVIVTYNRHDDLLENLYALNEQSEKDFEVIVLDNGGDLSWLKKHTDEFKFGFLGIELEFNFGPSPARNIGTEFAKGRYIAFLDDDAVADKNLVRNIVEHFENHNISGLRGKVLPKNQTGPENIPIGYDLGDQIIIAACEVSCLSAFRKDVLIKTGGFDELLFGSEGMELSYRICKSQKEKMQSILYFPDVIVYHNFHNKGAARTEKTLRQELMGVLVWRKDNNLIGYKKHIHSLYPRNRDFFENFYNNYPWMINIAIYLSNTFPEEAVEWAKKAIALKPERFKGCYILGSLYTDFGRYDEALPLLERIYGPLHNSVMSDRNESVSSEFEGKVDISECYIKTCTKLAQCYIQNKQYEKIRRIYTELLHNRNLTLAKEQKADILNVLRSLNKISSMPAIIKNKAKAIVSAKSEDDYLVSAIISTYNSEKFLSGCLEDLTHQTIADKLEIIVVNSGSQENEEAIVHEYQQKYDNIVYIKTEQREGIYSAWNRAAKVARGTFLTNANTDDRHRDDALEIMAETLLANPDIALVYGDQICTDTPNCTFANHHVIKIAKRPEYSFERLLFGCCVGSQPMWRKTLHNECGYFDETLTSAGDWDFWLRISNKYKFKHIPEFLGLYYHNENGIEHGNKIHSLYERYIVGKRYGNPYISVIPLYHNINNPLVSVITPAYNAAEYIAATIESVLIQNYRNFELIIVDDGSTDNTKDIVTSFKDDKIKYLYKDNCGPSGARNLALSKSKGQYIMPLDADDMMTPDFITKHLVEFQKHPDADLIYCDVLLIDKNNHPIRIMNKPDYQDRRHLIRDLLRAGHPIVPFRFGIKRSVFDKIGFYDEDLLIAEDYDMIRRFVKAGLKAHHLSQPLHLRRMHTDSLSTNYSAKKAKCHFEVIRRFADTFTYDELFPDVAWDEIEPRIRQLHAKCLTAGTYLAIGQEYVKSNALEYSKTAFDQACSELNDCIKMDPENQDLQQLFKKSQLIQARYAGANRQVVSKEMKIL